MYQRMRVLRAVTRALRTDLVRFGEIRNSNIYTTSFPSPDKANLLSRRVDPPAAAMTSAATPCDKVDDDADVFGTLSPDVSEKYLADFETAEDDMDEQDLHEAKIADIYRPGKEDYLRKMKELIDEKNDLVGALDLFEIDMKEQLVQPTIEHFRLLIHGCAKVGHITKAMSLHRQYKSRGLTPHAAMYVYLFSACTKTENRALGLQKATLLLNEVREKHIIINKVLYNAMIQAFGRCGDLKTALYLMDEVKSASIPLDRVTFSLLLQGCITDKESGFRHALIIWRNMRRKRIRPDIFAYNLIIRCAVQCGMGDLTQIHDILLESVPLVERKLLKQRLEKRVPTTTLPLEPAQPAPSATNEESLSVEQKLASEEPKWYEIDLPPVNQAAVSLLEPYPNLSEIVALRLEDTPKNRLLLLGGPKRIIDVMKEDEVSPDLKTISQLLGSDKSEECERIVFELIESLNLKLDTGFFNQLMKHRLHRRDYKGGIQVLAEMNKHEVQPDILTFGLLALCTSTRKEGITLLTDIRSYGAKPNLEILTALLKKSADRCNPADVQFFLGVIKGEAITVDRRVLHTVENFHATFKKHIKTKEDNGYVPHGVVVDMRQGYKNWKKFDSFYLNWLNQVKFEGEAARVSQYQTTKEKLKKQEEQTKRAETQEAKSQEFAANKKKGKTGQQRWKEMQMTRQRSTEYRRRENLQKNS